MKTPKKISETWQKAQKWELSWHGNCINSLNEELKQLVYAEKMGLSASPTPKTPYNFDLKGRNVLDIGGGPYSLLLKCANVGKDSVVVDPLMFYFPTWVKERYVAKGILTMNASGEELQKDIKNNNVFDEIWLYNVLEHTYAPKQILKNARSLGKVIRIFEWLDTPPNIGHPQTLKEDDLNKWLGGEGKVEFIKRSGATGKCYYGVFKGDHYEKV